MFPLDRWGWGPGESLQVFWGGSKLRPWKNTGNPSSNVLCQEVNTVDGSEIRRAPSWLVVLSRYLQGLYIPGGAGFLPSTVVFVGVEILQWNWWVFWGKVSTLPLRAQASKTGDKTWDIFVEQKWGPQKMSTHKKKYGYNFVKEKTQWKIVDALPKNYNSELNAGKPWCLFGRLLIFKFFRCVSGGELFVFVGERTAQRISPQRTLNWICFATQKKEIMRIDGPESQFFVGFRKTNYPEIIVFYHFLA